ncbi:hypothetical protein ACFFMM_11805 [Micromonospora chaiyaphumensis]|nr:hypothetical protein [Micromonospora chaiyaphumensis]
MTVVVNARLKPSRTRRGRTYDFHLDALPGSLTVNELPDGRPAEIFLKAAKQGSTLAGLCESLSITTSLALQYGTPVVDVVCRMINARFEPSGRTGDPEVPVASSLSDYIARRLAVDYLSPGQLAQLGLLPPAEATAR